MKRESLKEQARRLLSDAIMGGILKPGDRIDRRTVAARLGMSVAPVMEAMLLLTEEGMLDTRPRRGTRVRVPTHDEVLGRFLVRESLECQVARESYGEPIARNWLALKTLAETLDACPPISNERWRAEVEFHSALADLVGSATFSALFRKNVRANLFFELKTTNRLDRDAPCLSHVRLLEDLRDATSPEEAEAAIRHHLRNGKDLLLGGAG